MKLPDFVISLVDQGIPVTIKKGSKGIYFDLNLESKSHLYLYEKDDRWFVDMRYNTTIEIDDINDIYSAARQGMHGRDFISHDWERVLIKNNYLKVVLTTTTTKSYE